MAQTIIQHENGTATVISDTFAPYGEVGGTPSRPEKNFVAENRENRITDSALRKQFGDAAPVIMGAPDFPKPIGRSLPRFVDFGIGEPTYSKAAVNEWIAAKRALAALLPREVI